MSSIWYYFQRDISNEISHKTVMGHNGQLGVGQECEIRLVWAICTRSRNKSKPCQFNTFTISPNFLCLCSFKFWCEHNSRHMIIIIFFLFLLWSPNVHKKFTTWSKSGHQNFPRVIPKRTSSKYWWCYYWQGVRWCARCQLSAVSTKHLGWNKLTFRQRGLKVSHISFR